MSEGDVPDQQFRASHPLPRAAAIAEFNVRSRAGVQGAVAALVSFDRHEFRQIFNLYGRRVAEGEWRDYAVDFTPLKAVFSIYRRASEVPLYRVEKDPALARRQGAYSVVASTGMVLKRGPDLDRVLQVLERKPRLVVI